MSHAERIVIEKWSMGEEEGRKKGENRTPECGDMHVLTSGNFDAAREIGVNCEIGKWIIFKLRCQEIINDC